MNGDIACQEVNIIRLQITDMIKKGFQKAILVGHSSDDSTIIMKAF